MAEVTRQFGRPAGLGRWRTAAIVLAAGALSLGGQAVAQGKKADGASKSAWVKICDKAPVKADEKKEICITHHERLDGNTGMVLVSAAIRKIEGQKKERFLIMVPLGMAIPPGIQVRFDEQKEPIKLRYSICHPGGCTAETDASPELVQKLRKGNKLMVAAINALGKPIGFPVPLNGFTKAYEGQPVDSKKYADARRKLMTTIRQRQIARAKKQMEERKKQEEKAKQ